MTSNAQDMPDAVQDEMNAAFNAVMVAAESVLSDGTELYPFAAHIDDDGAIEPIYPAEDTWVGSTMGQLLDSLYARVVSVASGSRVAAIATDVEFDGGEGVRVELEHCDGYAIMIVVPYVREEGSTTVQFQMDDMMALDGIRRVWPAA